MYLMKAKSAVAYELGIPFQCRRSPEQGEDGAALSLWEINFRSPESRPDAK
jgi:hypothetical protein